MKHEFDLRWFYPITLCIAALLAAIGGYNLFHALYDWFVGLADKSIFGTERTADQANPAVRHLLTSVLYFGLAGVLALVAWTKFRQ